MVDSHGQYREHRLAVWRGICRVVGLAGVAAFLACAFTPLPNFLSERIGTPPGLQPSEAIVVLGGGITPDGTLSNPSLRRALHGITLYRQGLAPLLVFLGPARAQGPAEAEVRGDLARTLGISPEVILTETEAWTTREEAIRVGALLRPRGVRSILLVTDSQHLRRAQPLFTRAGFAVHPAPADDFSTHVRGPEGRLQLTRRVLQELLARLYYRIAGYF